MSEEFVIYNGVKVVRGWPEKIEESQHKTSYLIDGKEWPRIRYGDESEDWGADRQPCHDCDVTKGGSVLLCVSIRRGGRRPPCGSVQPIRASHLKARGPTLLPPPGAQKKKELS